MTYKVSITSQGQLTIPMQLRRKLGIMHATQADLHEVDGQLVVSPGKDFWSLEGSLSGEVKLSDEELKKVRGEFGKKWQRKM